MSLRRLNRVALPIACFVLAGCGGSGGSGVSRFAGHYTGAYASTATDNDDEGTLDVVVANDGTISGTVTDSRMTDVGTVVPSSRIRSSGEVDLSVSFGSPLAITRISAGTFARSGDTVTGTLNEFMGDLTESFDYTLTRVAD